MSRHVIGAFACVLIRPRFRSQSIERHAQIPRHIRISVLIDRQRCRRVLNEEMQQTNPAAAEDRQLRQDMLSYEMTAAGKRRQNDLGLVPGSHSLFVLCRHFSDKHDAPASGAAADFTTRLCIVLVGKAGTKPRCGQRQHIVIAAGGGFQRIKTSRINTECRE